MKPQEKVITAGDVQSSLYFFHVNELEETPTPEYSQASEQNISENPSPKEQYQDQDSGYTVQQKPVRDLNQFAARITENQGFVPFQEHATGYQMVDRSGGTFSRNWSKASDLTDSPRINELALGHKKEAFTSDTDDSLEPLPSVPQLRGPRPMHHRFQSADVPVLSVISERPNINLRRSSEHPYTSKIEAPPNSGRPPPVIMGKDVSSSIAIEQDIDPNTSNASDGLAISGQHVHSARNIQSPTYGSAPEGRQRTPITVIRRYDGEQSNVGKISIHGQTSSVGDISTFAEHDSPLSSIHTSIELATPGYMKFSRPISTSQIKSNQNNQPFDISQGPPLIAGQDTAYSCHIRRVKDDTKMSPPPSIEKPPGGHRLRANFAIRRKSAPGMPDQKPQKESSQPREKRNTTRLEPYMFRSPWGGVCKFTTGTLGRSLKCSHALRPGLASEPVSEFRFNLPSSKAIHSVAPSSPVGSRLKENKRPYSFSGSSTLRKSFDSSQSELYQRPGEAEKPWDLSLGQELAGGGFGGKQAKLGKLIIEQEGFKMLDLVVATNMALWWRAYEQAV